MQLTLKHGRKKATRYVCTPVKATKKRKKAKKKTGKKKGKKKKSKARGGFYFWPGRR